MDKGRLTEKYDEAWKRLLSSMPSSFGGDQRPTNPLLLDISEGFINADVKILFFGQETNDWEGDFPHSAGIYHLIDTYKNFYLNGCCFIYNGQFWNGISKLKQKLEEHFSYTGRTVSFLWNNIVKIGKSGGKGLPSNEILQWQDNWFDILREEVALLKPDIIIFLTGPYYDRFIRRVFDDAYFESINERKERQLARIKSIHLPVRTVRTYHPNYLWHNGFYQYLDEIANEIYC
jgi:hypothetical protein